MKKTTILILCCLLVVCVVFACGSEGDYPPEDLLVKTMLVDGAPLLSMVHMMSEETGQISGFELSFIITNDSDALVASLLNKEPDFAIAPINIAAMMHSNGSGYRLAAVTIWGIMQIVSDKDISSLEDLKGETIVAFSKSGTPGITLRNALRQNNIGFTEPDSINFAPDPDKVNIIYLTAASDVRDAIVSGMEVGGNPVSFGLLAEPVATAVSGIADRAGRPGFAVRINLQTEWEKSNNDERYPQAALIFHERLLSDNAFLVNEFISLAQKSSFFANDNPEKAGELAVELGSAAIPNGAIVRNAHSAGRLPIDFTLASDAMHEVNNYLKSLMEENAGLIGGMMPSDDFYYVYNDKE